MVCPETKTFHAAICWLFSTTSWVLWVLETGNALSACGRADWCINDIISFFKYTELHAESVNHDVDMLIKVTSWAISARKVMHAILRKLLSKVPWVGGPSGNGNVNPVSVKVTSNEPDVREETIGNDYHNSQFLNSAWCHFKIFFFLTVSHKEADS